MPETRAGMDIDYWVNLCQKHEAKLTKVRRLVVDLDLRGRTLSFKLLVLSIQESLKEE